MKYLIILGDGMADYRCADLGDKTPLQHAYKPNMDVIANRGVMGLVRTVAPGMAPGSDVANLSVMGYDPALYYTGRAPLEAVSMGVQLGETDVAFRCNLVTLDGEGPYADKIMADYSAGEIESARAAVLIRDLSEYLKSRDMKFYPGVSYRHLMVWGGGPAEITLTPPHDISGKPVGEYLPKGKESAALLAVMEESHRFLSSHPLNNSPEGVRPANSVWFWGQGKTPSVPGFKEKFSLSGAVISAVDLIKGIGKCAGMEVIEVEGATGNIHTNFAGKAKAALEAFRRGADLVYLHIEAPDEAGHQGDVALKVKAIEEIDRQVLGPLLSGMEEFGAFRLLLLPDHPTPLAVMTHTSEPVPFVIYDSNRLADGGGRIYCEEEASGGIFIEQGHHMMDYFING